MFPVRYELGFYIPEDGNLHSLRHESLKSYIDSFKSLQNFLKYLHGPHNFLVPFWIWSVVFI
jgi:hypothetical protein